MTTATMTKAELVSYLGSLLGERCFGLFIGAYGAGKTTIAKELKFRHQVKRISYNRWSKRNFPDC